MNESAQSPAASIDVQEKVRTVRAALEEAETVYQGLADLAREHSTVLEGGSPDADDLIRVAKSKQTQLSRLEGTESRMRAERQVWQEIQPRVSEEDRRSVQEAYGRVESVLRQLLSLEAEQQQALLSQRESTIGELKRIDAARKVQRAYSSPIPEPRGLVDQTE